jgi:hypothetical protein
MKELNPEFKKIVIEIERMRHEMDMTRASINSWIWNIQDQKADREYINMYADMLVEDLNTQTYLQSQLEELTHVKLTNKMRELNWSGTGKEYLDEFDRLKKQNNSQNLYVQIRNKKINEDIKTHPEKVIRMT